MRYIIIVLLFLITNSTSFVVADTSLLNIAESTTLLYEVDFTEIDSNVTASQYLEMYVLHTIGDQLGSLRAFENFPTITSKDEYADFYYDTAKFLHFNYTRFINPIHIYNDDHHAINPFYPGEVIIVNNLQFVEDYGQIHHFSYSEGSVNPDLFSYTFKEDGSQISINIFSMTKEFHGDSNSNYTIHTIKNHNMYYNIHTSILELQEHNMMKVNSTLWLNRVIREERYSKQLISSDIVPNIENEEGNSMTIERYIALSLLISNLVIFTYLERKKSRNKDVGIRLT